MAALAHTQTADSLAQQLHVALDKGLTASQVEKNQCKYGKNGAYGPNASIPFKDQLVLILLASAGISLVLAYLEEGEDKATTYVEPIVILAILIANAWVGVVQETNAEKAIEVRPNSE
ncbi:hypothetical protein NBRC10513v2_001477 [Rhodotorula toruloides]